MLAIQTRRPLRSSPLAGPALSHDEKNHHIEPDTEPKNRKVRIHPPSPSELSYGAPDRLRRHYSLLRGYTYHAHRAPEDTPAILPVPLLPSSLVRFQGKHKRKEFIRENEAIPAVPPPALLHPEQIGVVPLQVGDPSTSTRPVSRASPDVGTHLSNPTSPPQRRRSTNTIPLTSRDPADNWLSTNPYEKTPRFSRLGLGGSHVILPLSAKEFNKKVARSTSRPSTASTISSSSGSLSPTSESPVSPTTKTTFTGKTRQRLSSLPTTPSPSISESSLAAGVSTSHTPRSASGLSLSDSSSPGSPGLSTPPSTACSAGSSLAELCIGDRDDHPKPSTEGSQTEPVGEDEKGVLGVLGRGGGGVDRRSDLPRRTKSLVSTGWQFKSLGFKATSTSSTNATSKSAVLEDDDVVIQNQKKPKPRHSSVGHAEDGDDEGGGEKMILQSATTEVAMSVTDPTSNIDEDGSSHDLHREPHDADVVAKPTVQRSVTVKRLWKTITRKP